MQVNAKRIALVTIPVLAAGWVLFRPELLFVNTKVNESLPSSTSAMTDIVASGSFASGAHETNGKAELLRSGGKTYVRLSNFHTSNGPDVHVVLLRKGENKETGQGALDLGTIKGNIGDQNYEIPTSAGADFETVSIWCKRFDVSFGKASLTAAAKKQARLEPISTSAFARLASSAPIEVISGKVAGSRKFAGRAALIEESGKRSLQIDLKTVPAGGYHLRFVKMETLKVGLYPASAESIDLGAAKAARVRVPISKEIDAWLYRSIAIVNDKTQKIDAFILLRSEQERKKTLELA